MIIDMSSTLEYHDNVSEKYNKYIIISYKLFFLPFIFFLLTVTILHKIINNIFYLKYV